MAIGNREIYVVIEEGKENVAERQTGPPICNANDTIQQLAGHQDFIRINTVPMKQCIYSKWVLDYVHVGRAGK